MRNGERKKLLIVDDEELNRELLAQIFEEDYEIVMAENGKEAVELYEEYKEELTAVLLDIVMPVKDGYYVLENLHLKRDTSRIPVVMITANTDSDAAISCYAMGAAEVINKPFTAVIVRQRVRNMIEMYESREQLRQELNASERKLEQFNDSLIDTIANIVEFRDMESGQHVRRVKGLSKILAMTYRELYPESGLTVYQTDVIMDAAALHDIGKISIPDHILLKPGRLTDEERKIMMTHTTKGCDILAKLKNVQDNEHYKAAYEIVRHHHERYDGRGYPDGLVGEEIPLSAQLVSVADVYDALTSDRVYKKAYSREKAYQMICGGECGSFGEKMLHCFKEAREEIERFSDLLEKEVSET